jgi:lipoprotein-anchoring transpeptidase ErfK/SrfK
MRHLPTKMTPHDCVCIDDLGTALRDRRWERRARAMLKQHGILLCAIAGAILGAGLCTWTPEASAQVCDDRYPMACQGFSRPAPQAPQPIAPQVIAPYGAQPQITAPYGAQAAQPIAPVAPRVLPRPSDPTVLGSHAGLYGAVAGEPFRVSAVDLSQIPPQFLRRTVAYPTNEPPGTIVIDPASHFLYLVQEGGQAIRYGVGVGRQGFGWSGIANVHVKREWPDWYPPKEMIQRQPELRQQLAELQSGIGMPGGQRNPLGARALYLWQGNKDTLYRIHGTVEPWTIGSSVSSGCIRMINQDVIDLYQRTPINAKVVVLGRRL